VCWEVDLLECFADAVGKGWVGDFHVDARLGCGDEAERYRFTVYEIEVGDGFDCVGEGMPEVENHAQV